jgi:hypothetical protein
MPGVRINPAAKTIGAASVGARNNPLADARGPENLPDRVLIKSGGKPFRRRRACPRSVSEIRA